MRVTATFLLIAAISVMWVGFAAGETGEPARTPAADTKAKPETKPAAKAGANPMVVIETNYGNIKVELFKDKAPLSVENFLIYVKEGYYDSTIVHRVTTKPNGQKFVIQLGGITADMKQKPQKPGIKNEATNGLSNLRGTLSMARTSDINSGSSHFFINLNDNKFLDHTGTEPAKYGYAVFGKVTEGMDVVDKIAMVEVGSSGGYQDVPVKPVIIVKMQVAGAGAGKAATVEKKAEARQIGEPEPTGKTDEGKPAEKTTGDAESKTTK
jgi:peptidyl-prolyl cis-trans isomerase B (cyclophilin B)